MLSLLLFLPLLGIGVIALLPRPATRLTTTLLMLSTLGIGLWLLFHLDLNTAEMQYTEFHSWLSVLGLNYSLGVDYNPNVPFDDTVLTLGESLDGLPESLRSLQTYADETNQNLDTWYD